MFPAWVRQLPVEGGAAAAPGLPSPAIPMMTLSNTFLTDSQAWREHRRQAKKLTQRPAAPVSWRVKFKNPSSEEIEERGEGQRTNEKRWRGAGVSRLRNTDITDIRSYFPMLSRAQSELQMSSSYLSTFWKMHLPWTISLKKKSLCCYKGLHLRSSDLYTETPETFNHRNN